MKDPSNPVCRTISTLLSRIGDKWTVLVVVTLGDGPRRFNELRREIPSVSQRMLTLTLRNLERDGIVNRTVTPSIPPRVDYELTPLGHSLLRPITALTQWALENVEEIHSEQARFDAAQDKAEAGGARAVLVLYDVEGWQHEEIAAELGMAVGSSKAQLHRARHLLRARLEAHA